MSKDHDLPDSAIRMLAALAASISYVNDNRATTELILDRAREFASYIKEENGFDV